MLIPTPPREPTPEERATQAYLRHNAGLVRYCAARLRSREAGEDVAQETWRQYWQHYADRALTAEQEHALLYRIATYDLICRWRRGQLIRFVPFERQLWDGTVLRWDAPDTRAEADPGRQAERHEQAAALAAALDGLTAHERDALLGHLALEQPYNALAARVDRPTAGAAKALTYRATKRCVIAYAGAGGSVPGLTEEQVQAAAARAAEQLSRATNGSYYRRLRRTRAAAMVQPAQTPTDGRDTD